MTKFGEAYARFVAAYNQTGNDETRLMERGTKFDCPRCLANLIIHISFLSNWHRDMDHVNFDNLDRHIDIRLRKVPLHS